MKCTESWLREWANPNLKRQELAHELTMAGLEIEELIPVDGQDDTVFDISITPNRGDCLSIQGIAREVSAISGCELNTVAIDPVPATNKSEILIENHAPEKCPSYVSRVIEGIKADAATPEWMVNRLEQAGIRAINCVVDVTNYVMLELGQPMHAFDRSALDGKIVIRNAAKNEEIELLDASQQKLDDDTLVIADEQKALAIAGVMGSQDSGVTTLSKDIILEAAFFTPETVAKQRQKYLIHTESAHRFERGVDYNLQEKAIERATALIVAIAGGHPGPVKQLVDDKHLPKEATVELRKTRLEQILGIKFEAKQVNIILDRLSFKVTEFKDDCWIIKVPTYRFDITIEEDLIEEVARIYGYDQIPVHQITSNLQAEPQEAYRKINELKQSLSKQGYHEIISYSFVDPTLQTLLYPDVQNYILSNPMTSEMSAMRHSLLPGLIATMVYNKAHQIDRVQLFEYGVCFKGSASAQLSHVNCLAGLISGPRTHEQWSTKTECFDFYDLKGHVENLLRLRGIGHQVRFEPSSDSALHPGQSADILINNQKIGRLGALHPRILQGLEGLKNKREKIFLFEIETDLLDLDQNKINTTVSKFPEIRRDIAILLKQAIPTQVIQDTIIETAGDWLNDVFVFDVYEGKGVSPGHKSIALAMIFQHPTRTLVDDEVTKQVDLVIKSLQQKLGAELRS